MNEFYVKIGRSRRCFTILYTKVDQQQRNSSMSQVSEVPSWNEPARSSGSDRNPGGFGRCVSVSSFVFSVVNGFQPRNARNKTGTRKAQN